MAEDTEEEHQDDEHEDPPNKEPGMQVVLEHMHRATTSHRDAGNWLAKALNSFKKLITSDGGADNPNTRRAKKTRASSESSSFENQPMPTAMAPPEGARFQPHFGHTPAVACHSVQDGFNYIEGGLRHMCTLKRSHIGPCASNRHRKPTVRDTRSFGKWLRDFATPEELSRDWVILSHAPGIRINGYRIKAAMVRTAPFDLHLCAAAMRSYKEIELDSYLRAGELSPRHYTSPEWSIISSTACADKACIDAFAREPATITLADCKMVLSMVKVGTNWSCYAFDFVQLKVTVMDPLMCNTEDSALLRAHNNLSTTLLSKAIMCMQSCTKDCTVGSGYWVKSLLTTRLDASSISSICALNYARWFNGITICDPLRGEGRMTQCKKELLLMIINDRRNEADLPVFFKELAAEVAGRRRIAN